MWDWAFSDEARHPQQQQEQSIDSRGGPLDRSGIGVRYKTVDLLHRVARCGAYGSSCSSEKGDPLDWCEIGVRCKTVDLSHRVARRGASSSSGSFEQGDPLDRGGIGVRSEPMNLPHRVAERGAPSSVEPSLCSSSSPNPTGWASRGFESPSKKRKFARDHGRATRAQRLGSTNGLMASGMPPDAVDVKAARAGGSSDPAVSRNSFKQLVAQASGGPKSGSIAASRDKRPSSHLEGWAMYAEAPIRSTRIRTDDPLHFPIHDVAVFHSLATSGSEDGLSEHGGDSEWWHGVEALMEDDRKADERWWQEVETFIMADASNSSFASTSLRPDEPSDKRELLTDRCGREAKRLKRPG